MSGLHERRCQAYMRNAETMLGEIRTSCVLVRVSAQIETLTIADVLHSV